MNKGKKRILIIVGMIVVIGLVVHICKIIYSYMKPDSDGILRYAENEHKRDFEVVETFTYISHTDGEVEFQRELKCPAVILRDKENEEIRFLAYAYPLEGGDWIYRDNYTERVLLYCIRQEELEINNEDVCEDVKSSRAPCLVLENTDETAQKLQNMVVHFNELCQCDDGYGAFQVEGSIFLYQIQCGNVTDRWLDDTSPFCYDTPLEKYKAFLDKLEKDEE